MENKIVDNNPYIVTMADDLNKVRSQKTILSGAPLKTQMVRSRIASGTSVAVPVAPKVSAIKPAQGTAFKFKPDSALAANKVPRPPMSMLQPPRPSRIIEKKREIKPLLMVKSNETEKKVMPWSGIKEIESLPNKWFNLFFGINKKMATIITIAVVFIVGGIAFYQFADISLNQSNEPTTVEEMPSSGILTISDDKIIKVDQNASSQLILEEVRSLLNENYSDGTFTRILIRESTFDSTRNIKYLSFSDFKKLINENFNIDMPASLINSVDSFDLVIYSHNQVNRLVLVARTNNIPTLFEEFNGWEKTMKTDLTIFLSLMEIDSNKQDSVSFNDNEYKDTQIRYLNFNGHENTIDYAVIPEQNVFIITSSRDSMYAVLDDLL